MRVRKLCPCIHRGVQLHEEISSAAGAFTELLHCRHRLPYLVPCHGFCTPGVWECPAWDGSSLQVCSCVQRCVAKQDSIPAHGLVLFL